MSSRPAASFSELPGTLRSCRSLSRRGAACLIACQSPSPSDSAMGTVRGDFCIDVGRNICHGSDAVESAEKEIALWFKPEVRSAPPPASPSPFQGG